MSQTTNTQEGTTVNRPPDAPMVRPREGRVIAGVALAVADRLGMAPGAVRLVWFILGWVGGLGILLYLAGWLLIPEEGAETSIAEDLMGRSGDVATWIGVILIVVAGIALLDAGNIVRTDMAWAAGLLILGILVFRGDFGRGRSDEPRTAPVTTEPGVAAAMAAMDDDGAPVRAPKQPRVRPERSILGRLTVGTILVAIGGMLALDTADVIDPSTTLYLAVTVGIIGVGLLVGSFVGRSRGLIFLGLAVLPVLLAASAVTARFDGGFGDRDYAPRTIAEVQERYSLTAGDLELDLSRLDLGASQLSIRGDVGFGRLVVLVPAGSGLNIRAHAGFGDVTLFGDANSGISVDGSAARDGEGREGMLFLDLHVGFGQIEVMEVSR